MKLTPFNKYLVLEAPNEQDKQESLIALPEGYKKKVESHKVYKILAADIDSVYVNYEGEFVLVPTNAVEEINIAGNTFLVCSEHSLLGMLS